MLVSSTRNKKGQIIKCMYQYRNKVKEYYYSPLGVCLAILEKTDNKETSFLIFDYSVMIVRKYNRKYDYTMEWLNQNIRDSEDVMVVCDGPVSAKKMAGLKSKKIVKVYVLHHNHHNKGNAITDAWNLANKDKFDALIALTPQHKWDIIKEFDGNNIYDILNFNNRII